jgi:hypothetical protein
MSVAAGCEFAPVDGSDVATESNIPCNEELFQEKNSNSFCEEEHATVIPKSPSDGEVPVPVVDVNDNVDNVSPEFAQLWTGVHKACCLQSPASPPSWLNPHLYSQAGFGVRIEFNPDSESMVFVDTDS